MTYQISELVLTELAENCYICHSANKLAVAIDPGGDVDVVLRFLKKNGLDLQLILNTHGHADHVGGNAELRKATGARIGISADESVVLGSAMLCGATFLGWDFTPHEPDFVFYDGQTVGLGDIQFEVIHTPGHTPGSCIFVDRQNGVCFSGDLVFRGSIGRYDLPGGSRDALFDSLLSKFLQLPDSMAVYPGHGGATTVGIERRSNPFLSETGF